MLPQFTGQRSSILAGVATLVLVFSSICSTVKAADSSAAELTTTGPTSDWPQFHGPAGIGTVEGNLPSEWTANDYAWTVSLSGTDIGSPVIVDGVIYLIETAPLNSDSQQLQTIRNRANKSIDLVAFDLATGNELWRRKHPLVDRGRHSRNSAASTTPVVSGNQVFFVYCDAEGVYVQAYGTDSTPHWTRELGPWTGVHGYGTSPMVVQDKLVLFNAQQAVKLDANQVPGQSRVLAMDKKTGEDIWSTPLETTRPSYGVPAVHPFIKPGDDPANPSLELIMANTGNGIFSLDADTGKMRWSIKVFDKRSCSSPLVVTGLPGGDLAIGTCGSGGGGNMLSAVRIPASAGDQPQEAFQVRRAAPYVPTSAVKGQYLFAVSDSGIATCYDLNEDGRLCWNQRLGGNFGASPIIVGDRLLMISLDGTAYITSATATRSKIQRMDLGGRVGATPAYADGRLVIRVGDQLRCLAQ
ncbi:PQQ-like domain-containing protein [Neorhodopirellula lusitana]|uniref:PQQ-like domain-containing protein n=1 Tax=Neorhodopirellula lusitana TaxID=445327 RepID=A0ABY1QGJ8_9BACT|nr:PQQ-binding-like beta-propeller repeat protein [Neorhodopirellula lusitana]SMP70654.1 PQQ-like domain-containing protein [Neorhodopirellula lusitana]